jgi:serine/threonine-protein kinase HipA
MKQQAHVCMGQAALPLGELTFAKEGAREYSAFTYAPQWLSAPERFEISADLPLVPGYQTRRAPSAASGPAGSVFHHALADTEPDAWGRRVIARAHARARRSNPALGPLTAFDHLCAVDDYCRVGALRLRDAQGQFLGNFSRLGSDVPPLVDLGALLQASRAVEAGTETAADLRFLQGRGTSLGGLRPKCTVRDADGTLAIGKFPSLGDQRNVERGEVLALALAQRCGITAAKARIEPVEGLPVAVITRFDRTLQQARIPYLSAASMLQAEPHEDRAYTELADVIRARCANPNEDLRQLWRRLVFNLLITNVDDHLRNLGFLHVGRGFWRLAPAFDLNPFPDKQRESKTWLSEALGPIDTLDMLMGQAAYFALDRAAALRILGEVHAAVRGWRRLAASKAIGLTANERDEYAPAFEHTASAAAREWLR